MIPDPINALKITICSTQHTRYPKQNENKSNMFKTNSKNQKIKNSFYYTYNFHNTYFIYFVYSVYFVYCTLFYIL